MNPSVFPYDFCLFWKGTMYGYLYCENEGLERLPDDVVFVLNLNINIENMHASWLHAQDDSCMRMSRASLALIFQKYIYVVIKSYIFHFNISQVNLISDWALNQP